MGMTPRAVYEIFEKFEGVGEEQVDEGYEGDSSEGEE